MQSLTKGKTYEGEEVRTRKMSINLLFIAGGRRVSLLERFRKHLSANDHIYTTDTDPLAPTRFVADRTFCVPPCIDKQAFCGTIKQICTDNKIAVVIPLFDKAIDALAGVKIENTKMLVCSEKDNQISNDKLNASMFFRNIGLSTPAVLDEVSFPVFVRKRDGASSKGAELICNLDQLRTYWKEYGEDNKIYTEFIKGQEYTVDIYKSFDERVISIVPRKRIEARSGEVQKAQIVIDQSIVCDAHLIAQNLDTVGPITCQCIRKNDINYWIEVNCRFGGGCILSIEAGANSPKWIINELNGYHVKPLNSYEQLYMTRADREFFTK